MSRAKTEDEECVALRFGENLRRHRLRLNLSQDELGSLASVHRTEIGMLEQGQRLPRLDTLVKIVSALEISADELVGDIHWVPRRTSPGGFSFSSRFSASAEVSRRGR